MFWLSVISLSSLDFVTEGLNSIVATTAQIDAIKFYCRAFFLVTGIVPSNWGSVSTLLLKEPIYLLLLVSCLVLHHQIYRLTKVTV